MTSDPDESPVVTDPPSPTEEETSVIDPPPVPEPPPEAPPAPRPAPKPAPPKPPAPKKHGKRRPRKAAPLPNGEKRPVGRPRKDGTIPVAPPNGHAPAPLPVVSAPATPAAAIAPIALSFEQMKELFAIASDAKTSSPELEAAIVGLNATLEQTRKLTGEVARTQRRSNAFDQQVSVFTFKPSCPHCQAKTVHPENGLIGHPKPDLLYDTYWPKGCKVWKDDASVLEVELFNSFTASCTARDGLWTATLKKKATGGGTLVVDAPVFHMDDRQSLPSLPQILMELLHGPKEADPMSLIDRVRALEEELARRPAAVVSA